MATFHVSTAGSNTAPYDTWAKAATSLATAVTAASTAFDTILIASDETQTVASATTYTGVSGLKIISANKTTSAQEYGAIISFTPASAATLKFDSANAVIATIVGVIFEIGVSGFTQVLTINVNLDNCKIKRNYAATLSSPTLPPVVYRNCTIENAAGVTTNCNVQGIKFINCTFFQAGGVPYPLFGNGISRFEGCDFSTGARFMNPVNSIWFSADVVNCLVSNSAFYDYAMASQRNAINAHIATASPNNLSFMAKNYLGIITNNTGVYLASNSDAYCQMFVSSAYASNHSPLEADWYNVFIGSTGSKTFSIKIANTGGILTDIDAYLEVSYYGSASNYKCTFDSSYPQVSGIRDYISESGSNLTDTAEDWTGITSEYTHTLSKTVTVNQTGWARARVCLAKPSTTIYVNPSVSVI